MSDTKTFEGKAIILAQIVCAITEAHLQPCEFARVQAGENPHDLIDANIALYGAWCGVYFEAPDLEAERTIGLLNDAVTICNQTKYDQRAIRGMLYDES
jgi:hypothetical protein